MRPVVGHNLGDDGNDLGHGGSDFGGSAFQQILDGRSQRNGGRERSADFLCDLKRG